MLEPLLMPPLKNSQAATPAQLGYIMPAEWEPHAATWLGWPHNTSDWPGKFESSRGFTAKWCGKFPRRKHPATRPAQAGRGFCAARFQAHRRGLAKNPVRHASDQSRLDARHRAGLCQKSGKRKAEGGNGDCPLPFQWLGQIRQLAQGYQSSETAARLLRNKLFHAEYDGRPFVIEGGGIEVNGRGTLISTKNAIFIRESKFAIPASASRNRIGTKKLSGVTNVLWLAKARKVTIRTATLMTSAAL